MADNTHGVHVVHDADTYFKIDPITRSITNTSAKVKLVQFDHNSERFTFEVPRYIEEHDMSQCSKIEIHYVNMSSNRDEQSAGVYLVDDVQVKSDNDELVVFSWLISGKTTKYAGTFNFLIRFACSSDDVIDYIWNTTIYSGIVVTNGMNNSFTVVTESSDVVYDSPHFEIVPNTRQIIVPSAYKVIGTLGEHGAEQLIFKVPKTIDGHNIKECTRHYVSWTNAKREPGYNDLTFLAEDDAFLYYSWTIRYGLTIAKGSVSFSVHFEDLFEDNMVRYKWSTTTCKECVILESVITVKNTYDELVYPSVNIWADIINND